MGKGELPNKCLATGTSRSKSERLKRAETGGAEELRLAIGLLQRRKLAVDLF